MNINLKFINLKSLRMKLLITIGFLIVMIAGSGTIGLMAVAKIQKENAVLSNVAYPLNQIAIKLSDRMQKYHINILNLLNSKNSENVRSQIDSLKDAKSEFHTGMTKLSALVKQNKFPLNLNELNTAQNDFFQQAAKTIDAHLKMLTAEQKAAAKLSDFEKGYQNLSNAVMKLIYLSQMEINAKEESGKTQIQSGDATVEELGRIFNTLFTIDIPVANGGTMLQNYLIQLNGSVRVYTENQAIETGSAIRKEFETIVEKFEKSLKRLDDRLTNEESGRIYQQVETEFSGLKGLVLAENGLFDTYRGYLLLGETIKNSKIILKQVTLGFNTELRKISVHSNQFNERVQEKFDSMVTQSQQLIGAVVTVSVVVGLLAACLLTVSMKRSMNALIGFSKTIADGDFLVDDMHVTSNDEIGQLTHAMNRMKSNLKANFEEIKSGQERDRSVISGLHKAMRVIKKIGEGDFSHELDVASNDILGELSTATNQMKDQLKRSMERDKKTISGLHMAMDIIKKLANGDFSQELRATSDDILGELTTAVNQLIRQQRSLLLKIKESALNIESSSKEIATSNQDLSVQFNHQAAALEETAASMEQMNAIVQSNAQSAKSVSEISTTARVDVDENLDHLLSTVEKTIAANKETLDKLNTVNNQVVEAMGEIASRSEKISGITTLMNDIAFQTNLLALNAAVEAARAGEQGKGFAVVASEVRNLAYRSSKASKQISRLVIDSLTRIDNGRQLVDNSDQFLQEMSKETEQSLKGLMEESSKTLSGISDLITEVSESVENISLASTEQAEGIEQINKAITDMEQITHQNSAHVEENATASNIMAKEASNLMALVQVFKVSDYDVKGDTGMETGIPAVADRKPVGKASVGYPHAVTPQNIGQDDFE